MNVICNSTKVPRRVVRPPAGTRRPDQFNHEIDDSDVVVLYVDGNAHAAPNARMPERLMVAGDLVVNCDAAARIPSDTWVGGDLLVVGSSGAAISLPPGLRVDGVIDLRGAAAEFMIGEEPRAATGIRTPTSARGGWSRPQSDKRAPKVKKTMVSSKIVSPPDGAPPDWAHTIDDADARR